MQYFKTLFVGNEFHELPEVDSTNSFAIQLLSKSKPADGTVIMAYNQRAGRGQIGSKWESAPDKNVNMSLIFYPSFVPVVQQFDLNIITALAVQDVICQIEGLEKQAAVVKIKWPNDIYIAKKKVAGILIQNSINNRNIQSSVVGIGVNVNQSEFISGAPNPVALKQISGLDYDLLKVAEQVCVALEKRYLQLKAGKRLILRAEYLTKLYQINKVATYQRSDFSYFTGILRGITDEGKLIIETEEGDENFDLKEVKFC